MPTRREGTLLDERDGQALSALEGRLPMFEIYIKTTPERLWEAITDSEKRARYAFGVCVNSEWTPGSRYESVHSQAGVAISGARTWRSTHRAGSSRASRPCGAKT